MIVEASALEVERDLVENDGSLAVFGLFPEIRLKMPHEPFLVEYIHQKLAPGLHAFADSLQGLGVVALAGEIAEGGIKVDHGVELRAVAELTDVSFQKMGIELFRLRRGPSLGKLGIQRINAEHAMAAAREFQSLPARAAGQIQDSGARLQVEEPLQSVYVRLDLISGAVGGVILEL